MVASFKVDVPEVVGGVVVPVLPVFVPPVLVVPVVPVLPVFVPPVLVVPVVPVVPVFVLVVPVFVLDVPELPVFVLPVLELLLLEDAVVLGSAGAGTSSLVQPMKAASTTIISIDIRSLLICYDLKFLKCIRTSELST